MRSNTKGGTSCTASEKDNRHVLACVSQIGGEGSFLVRSGGGKMMITRFASRQGLSVVCAVLLLAAGLPLVAQEAQAPAAQLLSPEQLDTLVAPVALYPDALLSQVLVAATYPLEVAEAAQWLQQNRNLQGSQLVDAARQQNWDASIQALVPFPDVLNRLNSDIRWTTDLGNAFLAQQADVMNAVQQMRAQAREAGRLNSSAQQRVVTATQGDRTVIEIQPTNPQVVYVPVYNPEYIWGPPVYGYYPPLFYSGIGYGFGYGPGIYIGGFFGGLGWGGWGWQPNWFGCSIYENSFFFGHYGYHGFGGGGRYRDGGIWAHNPEHRWGVPYSNRGVASRFHGSYGSGGAVAGGRFGGQRGVTPRNPSIDRTSPGGSSGFRGNSNARIGGPGNNGAQGGGWSHFGQTKPGTSQSFTRSAPTSQRATPSYGGNHSFSNATPSYRPSPSYGGSAGSNARPMPSYRSNPSYGAGGGNRGSYSATPSYRPSPSYGGGQSNFGHTAPSYHSTPSYGGGGYRSSPSVSARSSSSSVYHGGGGGGSHGSGGGAVSHGGGGGGSNGGGGKHR